MGFENIYTCSATTEHNNKKDKVKLRFGQI